MKKFNKIREALAKLIEESFNRVSTDKGILSYDAEELAVGISVSLVDEEGNEVAAEDGDYKLENDRILRVAEGKIAEIIEPEVEPEAPAEETPVEETAEEETPAEEPEVENPTNEGEESDTDAVVKLREEVNELYSLVEALTKRVDELENKPAAEPAKEEFKKTKTDKLSVSKNAHYDFLSELNKA